MRFLFRCALSVAAVCTLATLVPAQDWKTAEQLPGIDFAGLSAAQKTTALKILRDQGCSCGCNMKLAECRVVDPACTYSKGLASTVVAAVKEGKSEADAVAAAKATKWAHVQAPKVLDDPVSIPTAGAPSMGSASAPITIVEFSDFQCPYCAAAVPQISALMKTFPGQIRLIFKEFPLEIHSQADLAAAAAVAANKQGKFWEMHDQMFANRDDLSRKNILAMATRTGLDMKRFEDDIDSTEVRETVVRDVQDGGDAGVEGTPTIFINGQKYNSAIRSDLLKPIVEAELKHAQPSVRQSASAR